MPPFQLWIQRQEQPHAYFDLGVHSISQIQEYLPRHSKHVRRQTGNTERHRCRG